MWRLTNTFMASRPLALSVIFFLFELRMHGAAGTRIALGLPRLLLSIAVLRARICNHHMPNLLSCRIVSACATLALSNNWLLSFAAFVKPSFGKEASISPDKSANLAAGVHMRGMTIDGSSLDTNPFWGTVRHEGVASLHTNGDGCCSIHAAVGVASARQELRHPDARNWIARVLENAGEALAILVRCFGAGRGDIWTNVFTILTDELLLPWLRGEWSVEARCLGDAMSEHTPEVLVEAMQSMQLTGQRQQARARGKARVLRASRFFFDRRRERSLVQPLRHMLGYSTSGSFDDPACLQKSDGSLCVRGTQEAFPEDAALSKYEVLFDHRACFDALRWDFLVSADPGMQVRTFCEQLTEVLHSRDDIDPESIPELSAFLDALRDLDALHLGDALPPTLGMRAWPAYVKCLQDPRYWLAADELLMLCFLAKQSVAIFERHGSVLQLAASYMPQGAAPVCVKIDSDRNRRVRSHFERLVFAPAAGAGAEQPVVNFVESSAADTATARSSSASTESPKSVDVTQWLNFQSALKKMNNETLSNRLETFLAHVTTARVIHIDIAEMDERRAEMQTREGLQKLLHRLHWAGSQGSDCGPHYYEELASRFCRSVIYNSSVTAQRLGSAIASASASSAHEQRLAEAPSAGASSAQAWGLAGAPGADAGDFTSAETSAAASSQQNPVSSDSGFDLLGLLSSMDFKPVEPDSESDEAKSSSEESGHSGDEVSDDEDVFAKISHGTAALNSPQGRWHHAVEALVPLLREDILLPLDPFSPGRQSVFADVHEGVCLPLWHCPFQKCAACWKSSDASESYERGWWQHVWGAMGHKGVLLNVLRDAGLEVPPLELPETAFALTAAARPKSTKCTGFHVEEARAHPRPIALVEVLRGSKKHFSHSLSLSFHTM